MVETKTSESFKSCREIVITRREIQVLQMISEGLTVKEIAKILFVSRHTIDSHKKNLLSKLNAKNSVDLIVKSIRYNFVNI